ncbi:MAG: threonine/serine exporter family protein [Corynebacterium sp.]|nr:threonine/serine exporter family protein [Corynebacterium sp.]
MREGLSNAKETRQVNREYELALINHERQQQQFVSNALGFLKRMAEAMAECGYDSGTIEEDIAACANAWGITDVHVHVIGRAIIIQHSPLGISPTVVIGEATTMEAFNLNIMHGLRQIRDLICSGNLSLGQADAKLCRLLAHPLIWPWWVSALGGMMLACSITLQSNGTVEDSIIAMFVLLVVNRVGALLDKLAVFRFFQLLIQSILFVGIGVGLYATGILTLQGAAALIGACIILIIPIPQIVAVAEDAIRGFHVTAWSRFFGIFLSILAICIGIGGAFAVARTKVLFSSDTVLIFPTLNFGVALIAALVGALGNGLFMNGWPRVLIPASVAGVITGAINLFLVREVGLPSPLSVAIGGAVLGFGAVAVERKLDVPAKAIILTGLCGGLLPGLDMYRSMIYLMLFQQGASTYVIWTIFIILAIGGGIVLGTTSIQTRGRMRHRRAVHEHWTNTVNKATIGERLGDTHVVLESPEAPNPEDFKD